MVNIQHLDFAYPKQSMLFKELSLKLQPGNIYGLLGENGAGKTSLLKLISGLLYPDSGVCLVHSYEANKRIPQMLSEIYMIPEEFDFSPIYIDEFVKINGAFYPRFNYQQFLEYMKEFNMETQQKLSRLSYGQKKKVLLSFGLATNAKLIILDEPTNGLDIPSKSQFRKVLASSISEDQSYIISTHQVRDMESLIDPIVVLDNGKVIFNQSVEEISRYLSFKVVRDDEAPDTLIYGENLVNGKVGILENTEQGETQINLELLFNAIIKENEKINQAFKK
ncbi:MAG: ATP-binding cassette domain-containing protein [Bacteroidota bacterium]